MCAIHILLSDALTQVEVNAAKQMLLDFCILLPELYEESSCTANAHQLLHLAKYVRLWGPLRTHSLFGFENKNGHLKSLFHSKGEIVSQLILNVDVSYALQVNSSCSNPDRNNMTKIFENTYIVGKITAVRPTSEQALIVGSTSIMETFSRLFKRWCGLPLSKLLTSSNRKTEKHLLPLFV